MFLRSLNHLRNQANLPPVKTKITQPSPLLLHFLRTDPEGHFVAVNEKNRIVGYASSIVREFEWFLAMLFVTPSCQTSGIGRKLLERAMKYGEKAGCTRLALATFSYNPQAIAVYSKQGMPPNAAVLMLSRGEKTGRRGKLKPELTLNMNEVTDEGKLGRLSDLDRKVRGIARPEEHFFWLGSEGYKTFEFRDGRKFAGYAVMSKTGLIGPIATTKPEYLEPILVHCLNSSPFPETARNVIFVHGEQKRLLQTLLGAGFRIEEVTLVMASERFSDPMRYLPGTLAHY